MNPISMIRLLSVCALFALGAFTSAHAQMPIGADSENATAQEGEALASALDGALNGAQRSSATALAADGNGQDHALELLGKGSSLYASGQYAQAAETFAELARLSPGLAAYYNLGNAYYRSGQFGYAIAAYEKARALAPSNPDVAANLRAAHEAARISEPPRTHWQDYALRLSPNTWAVWLAISFWATLALLLLPPLYRKRFGIWRPSLLTLSILVLVLSVLGLLPWRTLASEGTILVADTPLLLAPASASPIQSYVQPGQPARLIGSHGNFDRIELPDGNRGWVARSHFASAWGRNDGSFPPAPAPAGKKG